MKTTVWLKSQPNKKIEYPDCYPFYNHNGKALLGIFVISNINKTHEGSYSIEIISRVEFRPS